MKKFIFLNALCLLLATFISCSNNDDSPTVLPQQVTQSTFLNDWETMESLCINDNGKLDTKIGAPWNSTAASTLMPETVRLDVKKEDGWDMAFNLLNQDGQPDMNYFGLYNKYTGVLRVFYYCNKDVASTANDFAFEVILGSDGKKHQSYYSALNYGIPMDVDVSMNKNLLGQGGGNNTFQFLVTPYSSIGINTMNRGWYAFDINLSACSGKNLYTDGSTVQITYRANNNTSVNLATSILGKIGGDFNAKIDKSKLSASSSGIGGTLGDIVDVFGDIAKDVGATVKGILGGGVLGMIKPIGLWVTTAFDIASKATGLNSGGSEQQALSGKMNLKLNATAETSGYLQSVVATNVQPLTMGKVAFNPNSNVGKGIWNITTSPTLYFINDKIVADDPDERPQFNKEIDLFCENWVYWKPTDMVEYPPDPPWGGAPTYTFFAKDCRLPYFYDPSSFGVTINSEIFPDAENIKVLSFCGIYTNNGNNTQNTAFREALGLGDLKTNGLALPYPESGHVEDTPEWKYWKSDKVGSFYAFKTPDEYKEACIKFDGLEYKSYGNATDLHYYGQELSLDGNDSALNFIVEPQIFYAGWESVRNGKEYYTDIYFKTPTRLPELYVVVIVQFESGGKTFCYSRTFLPKVSEVKYEDAKTIVDGIKSRLDSQSDKIYRDEYKASLDKKMEFLKTE